MEYFDFHGISRINPYEVTLLPSNVRELTKCSCPGTDILTESSTFYDSTNGTNIKQELEFI